MAAMYALFPFCFLNTTLTPPTVQHIEQGAMRDSLTGQAFLATPASWWSSTPLVTGTQIDPKLAAYLVAYPST